MKPLILYHGGCPDGFCAAWVTARAIGDAELVPMNYVDPFDAARASGRQVFIVDFSLRPQPLHELAERAASVVVLDHHQSAIERLAGFYHPSVQFVFDVERSGARIAWDFFHAPTAPPWLVQYVEDRDLWRWALPSSREISAVIKPIPKDPSESTLRLWDELSRRNVDDVEAEGRVKLEMVTCLAEQCVDQSYIGRLGDAAVPVVNAPLEIRSEAADILRSRAGGGLAVAFSVVASGQVQLSMRGPGARELAESLGGGGHPETAGATVGAVPQLHEPRPWEGAA